MVNPILVVVDILLVVISAFFGLQAVNIWKKCPSGDIFKLMSDKPDHRMMLFYSTLFLGVMMATLSVIHGLAYVMAIDVGAINEIITSGLFLSIAVLTYSWYVFLKDATATSC